jgi:KDO2-lipid IV(A) lauroyltransferase
MGDGGEDEGLRRHSRRERSAAVSARLLKGLLAVLTEFANRMSIGRVVAIGSSVGRIWARLGLPRTARVRAQLAEAFPEFSEQRLDRTTVGVFEHFGRSLAELIALRGQHREALLGRVEVEGLEHFAAAEAASEGKGALVVSAHCGNWELGGLRVATLGIPLAAVFRGLSHPVLDAALLSIRTGAGSAPVDYQQIRMGRAGISLVRALKAGRKVVVLLDQNAPREEGVFVPFFGRRACVRTGPLKLAMRAGAPILVACSHRNSIGGGHRLRIHAPVWVPSDSGTGPDAVRPCAEKITALIEAEIREDPTQWIWTHRRWRTQPDEAEKAIPGR